MKNPMDNPSLVHHWSIMGIMKWDTPSHRRMQLLGGEEDPDIAFFDWDSPQKNHSFIFLWTLREFEGTPAPNLVFNIV